MPSLGRSANLDSRLIESALELYAQRLRQTPEPFKHLHAGLVVIALGLADQNWHRMEILDDRTIMVHNYPVW